MIRFSPIFSGGVAGAALLLMRIATAATLLMAALHALRPDAWQVFATAVLALGLLAGVFTRVVGGLAALLLVMLAMRIGGAAAGFVALHGIQALALALLGAGAYSVDARLFGRRVIRLDDDRDPFG